jgi:hypothetical protein
MTNNGKTLNAKFYANDGSVKDHFTINKHGWCFSIREIGLFFV